MERCQGLIQIQVACTCAGLITRLDFPGMAFNLKKVLKALLLSSSQPLSIKDIQGAFARFHDQAQQAETVELEGDAAAAPTGSEAEPAADGRTPAAPAALPPTRW